MYDLKQSLLPCDLLAVATVNAAGRQQWQLPPVDIVYAWVNGTDPAFAQRYSKYTNSSAQCDRVMSSNELLIGLTAICHHQRWVRQVIIAVDQQDFSLDFLPPGCPPVHFVDLSEFVPQQYLPTFNSHVFETFLWRIPGLSEHFMYLNDDMILARPINPASLFQQSDAVAWGASFTAADGEPNGTGNTTLMKANLRDPPYSIPPDPSIAQLPAGSAWLWPRINNAVLFRSAFGGVDPAGHDSHSAMLLTKQAMQRTWDLFGDRLDAPLRYNKKRLYASLREGGDVHFTSLAQQVGTQLGLMVNDNPLKALMVAASKGNADSLEHYVEALFNTKKQVVCLQELQTVKDQDLAKLCALVADVWCATVPRIMHQRGRSDRCGLFHFMCSQRTHCISRRLRRTR